MIHHVRDLNDPRVAAYARVGDAAWIKGQGLFVAEGRLVVRRLVESGRFPIRSVLATAAAHRALAGALPDDLEVFVTEPPLLESVTGFNFHRGCLALASRGTPVGTTDFFRARRLLALQGIGNPDNVGGVFRVAAAFGVDGVIVDGATADPFYRKAIRTGMGAVFQVPFARADLLVPELARLRSAGFSIAALTPHPPATMLADYASRRTGRVVLVLGSEGAGIDEPTLAACDDRVRIPITSHIDSLNVVVAAGIALAALA